jgi:hypothetical protein
VALAGANQRGPTLLSHEAPVCARHRGETGDNILTLRVDGTSGIQLAIQDLLHDLLIRKVFADALGDRVIDHKAGAVHQIGVTPYFEA